MSVHPSPPPPPEINKSNFRSKTADVPSNVTPDRKSNLTVFCALGKTIPFYFNQFSTRPHQNVVWCNNSWLGFLKFWIMNKRKRKIFCKKMSSSLSQLNVAMAHRIYFRRNNLQLLKLATYTKIVDHYS